VCGLQGSYRQKAYNPRVLSVGCDGLGSRQRITKGYVKQKKRMEKRIFASYQQMWETIAELL
jgi:hypothetical protein